MVPDLILPEERCARIEGLRSALASPARPPDTLHRLTVFTTFRCNLACRYCNTIHRRDAGRGDYDLASFRQLLDSLASSRVRHVHFTGGEATLVKDLPAMVGLATERGVLCSLTTNGTARPRVYQALADAGLREVRVSCDTHEPRSFDRIVGRTGQYSRVARTLKGLARLRDDAGLPLRIIVNTCVGRDGCAELPGEVRRSMELGVDDVKLLPASQDARALAALPEASGLRQGLEDVTRSAPVGRYPLLRRKIADLFEPAARGFTDFESQLIMRRCYVPLAERTVDRSGYYPCPVYLREGGAPLGRLDEDDLARQHERTLDFVRRGGCLDDPICNSHCITCLKRLNLFANVVLDGAVRNSRGEERQVDALLEHDDTVPEKDVRSTLETIECDRRNLSRRVPYVPFLVVKPAGMHREEEILDALRDEGLSLALTAEIPRWSRVAIALYSDPLTAKRVRKGLVLEQVLPTAEGTDSARLVVPSGGPTLKDLAQIKARIRARFSGRTYVVRHGEELFVTHQPVLHTPDEETYWLDHGLLLTGRNRPENGAGMAA